MQEEYNSELTVRHEAPGKGNQTANYERVFLAASSFVVFGAVFYHYVEHLSWLDAFYFTTMTLATVGYGDIAPRTDAGKLFTMFYVLIGISIFVVLARVVLAGLLGRGNNRPRK